MMLKGRPAPIDLEERLPLAQVHARHPATPRRDLHPTPNLRAVQPDDHVR